jgi:hypothetical protein
MTTSTVARRNPTMDEYSVRAYMADVTAVSTAYTVAPSRGEIIGFRVTRYVALAGSDTVITPNVNGTAVTGGALTLATSGDAAGDVVTVWLAPVTAAAELTRLVNEGDVIAFVSGGESDDAATPAMCEAIIRNRRH